MEYSNESFWNIKVLNAEQNSKSVIHNKDCFKVEYSIEQNAKDSNSSALPNPVPRSDCFFIVEYVLNNIHFCVDLRIHFSLLFQSNQVVQKRKSLAKKKTEGH